MFRWLGFSKYSFLKSGAVDAIEYDCLTHNVYAKHFNHGEQKSKWIQAVWDIESSAEHWKYQM